ncbi:MAG: glycerophosphodiester phosphodiesterase [Candidatus Yanofskybacteria bacterium]|nr:glycerophosphodiester phosphodiesterase [Candidatus Yanofskybacteria bacterium]
MGSKKVEIWSHQGKVVPLSPGNRLADFEDAVEECADGVETDVGFVKVGSDKEIFIYHPGQRFSALRLGEFVEFLKKHPRLECFLDIKQNDLQLVKTAIKSIVDNRLQNRVYFTFCQVRLPWLGLETSGKLLLQAKLFEPRIKTHLMATFPFSLPRLVEKYHPDFISFGWLEDWLSRFFFKGIIIPFFNFPKQIRETQKMGVRVLAGIFNREEDIRYFADMGIDAIMTENIGAAFKILEKPKAP